MAKREKKVMKVAVLMGSTSDWDVMKAACETLEELGIEYEKRVISAHRTPDLMYEFAKSARERRRGEKAFNMFSDN